jgi:hypothetical protein
MSVLIRGMEMPKRCGLCPCARSVDSVDWYCWQCTATEKVLNKFDVQESRPQHCPLVEVKTPHGRLIDADEMVSLWKGCTFEGDITCLLDPRPTVLEAEE